MCYPACLLLGVLAQRSLASQKPQLLRILGAVVCVAFALLFGALITRAVLSTLEGFGGMFGAEPPELVRAGIGAVIGAGLCALGFRASKGNDAKDFLSDVSMGALVSVIAFFILMALQKSR